MDAFASEMPDADERQAFAEKVESVEFNYKKFTVQRAGSDSYSYLLFADDSLYLSTNGDDEVWAEACDFIDERGLLGDVESLHQAERKFLKKLGGIYKDAVSDWKAGKRTAARRRYADQSVLTTPFGNVDASNTAFFWGAGANVGGFRFTNKPGLNKQEFTANAARWERINLKKTGGHIPAGDKDMAARETAEQFAEMAEMWAEEQRKG